MQEIKKGWKKVKIGELTEILNGGTPSTTESDYWDGHILWFTPKDLSDYKESKYISNSIKKITDLGLKKSSAKIVPKNSIILSSRAPVGYVNIITEDFTTNQGCKSLIGNDLVNNQFLYYWLKINTETLENVSGGATFKELRTQSLKDLEITIPESLQTQQKIASILSKYDDLIENNNKRIKILEETAQSIYEQWFVKYNFPCEECEKIGQMHENNESIKMTGQPQGIARTEKEEYNGNKEKIVGAVPCTCPHIKMIESGNDDFGMIPEGWEVKKIGDEIVTLGGGTPSTENRTFWIDGSINWFSPVDLTKNAQMFISNSGNKINQLGLLKSSAKLFPAYSVMMTSRATIGVVAINTTPASTNQGFITCIPNEKLSMYQVYFWIKQNAQLIDNLASGATFKEITKTSFRKIPIIIPEKKISENFIFHVQPIFDEIENIQKQNQNLKETRDLLIPRLVSGELDVESLDVK